MEKEQIIQLAGGAVPAKKAAVSSSMLYSMVIFNDPVYAIIAILGAFISMSSAYYDFMNIKHKKEIEGEKCVKLLHIELGKAFLIGLIITVLSFMLFTNMTQDGFGSLGIKWLDSMLPSFWFIFTLALSTEAVTIWDGILNKIKRFVNA